MKSKKIDLNIYEDILRWQLGDYMWFDEVDNVLNICREKYAELEKLSDEKSKTKKGTKKAEKPFDFEAEICAYTENEELRQALRDFSEIRQQLKKAILTTATSNRLFNKLDRLCDDDKKKIELLERSIINNWQDIWDNKKESNKKINTNTNKKVISINTLSLSEDEMENLMLANNDLDNF